MNLRETTPWSVIGIVAVLFLFTGTTNAQRLVMLLGRDTGSMEVINSGSDPVDVDGYSVTSSSGLLNVERWNSLTDQGVAGFREANPRNEGLSELALPPASATLGGGDSVSLGNAYAGGQLAPSQEDVAFYFTVPSGDVSGGTVKYVGPSQVPTITVDRVTGNIELTNPGAFELDGYTIASPSGLLNPGGFAALASQSIGSWAQVAPSELFISELNLEGTQAFDANTTLGLGTAYDAAAGVPQSGEDLTFSYTTAEGVRDGAVTFVGPISDLVLQVDSISGEAKIQNLSPIAGPFDIVGYNISSPSGSLSVEAWTSFADTGNAGDGWVEANPRAEELSELNLTSSKLFASGTSIALGNILTGVEDLIFEYATVEGAVPGSVEYVLNLGGTVPGDCNGDGAVDAADLACVSDIAERDLVLGALNTLPGDLNGNGDVAFADFLVLSANFAAAGLGYTQGNIDLVDTVAFADFLVLSANFGKTPGATAAAIPEPAGGMLATLGLLICLGSRKRRHNSFSCKEAS